jgi:hypothetical protein
MFAATITGRVVGAAVTGGEVVVTAGALVGVGSGVLDPPVMVMLYTAEPVCPVL